MVELHVHLEGTVDAHLASDLAARHRVRFTEPEQTLIAAPFRGGSFSDFVTRWKLVGSLLRDEDDFAAVVLDYASKLAEQGCRYAEAIFSPAEPARLGVPWDTIFSGYCNGAQQARATHGVEIRLTPDITRSFTPPEADLVTDYAIRYRDKGVVGLGLGGYEAEYPPHLFTPMFDRARRSGLVSVPHAGEFAGPDSIRACIDLLHADRIRHGIRAIADPRLVEEIASREIVLDVCPTANVLLGIVPSIEQHPLPELVSAGVLCTVSTDNPAIFETTLAGEHAIAERLGVSRQALSRAESSGTVAPTRGEPATPG